MPRQPQAGRSGDRTAHDRATTELAELVPRLYRLMRASLDGDAGSPSLEQLRTMHRIDEGHDTVSSLAVVRQLRMSAISQVVDTLVARRWVSRNTDPHDRRRTRLAVTTSGRTALNRGRARVNEQLGAVLEHYEGPSGGLVDVSEQLGRAVAAYDAVARGPA